MMLPVTTRVLPALTSALALAPALECLALFCTSPPLSR
jgi:hypothetical protein